MIYAKKSLGQNFLIDLNVIKKITNLANLNNKHVFEIGPGKGALTEEILKKKPKSLTLIEKDCFFSKELRKKYNKNKRVIIFNEDILKFNLEKKIEKDAVIIGNLPYNISSQILVKIIKFKKKLPNFSKIIFMFQKEMADRIVGKFGTSKYGRLSILTNFKLNIIDKFNVSPNCFWPKPKILSTVITFVPKKNILYNIKNIDNLEKITNVLFSNKRKMINKKIKNIFKDNEYKNIIKLDLNLRPSDLKPEQYYRITELFETI
jgi:16S rRNA (adenine1518-N6/adenine1519-N6)-dimethyltransferase